MEKYWGSIRIKHLRDYILDNKVSECDLVKLHPLNWDDLIIEYRETYGESMPLPFVFLGVLVKEDTSAKSKKDQILVDRNTVNEALFPDYDQDEFAEDEIIEIFRCTRCGNLADFDGLVLEEETRADLIKKLYSVDTKSIKTTHLIGSCCKNRCY